MLSHIDVSHELHVIPDPLTNYVLQYYYMPDTRKIAKMFYLTSFFLNFYSASLYLTLTISVKTFVTDELEIKTGIFQEMKNKSLEQFKQ